MPVDAIICGVKVNGLAVMTSKYKGFDPHHRESFPEGTQIVFKHKDQLTAEQKAAIFPSGNVYNLTVRWPLKDAPQASLADRLAPHVPPKSYQPPATLPVDKEALIGFKASSYQETIKASALNALQHIFIEALAGTGKTSTLVWLIYQLMMLGLTRGKQIIYLAFNKSIQLELESKLTAIGMPRGTAQTTHAFGFAQLKRKYGQIEVSDRKMYRTLEKCICDKYRFDYSEEGFRNARKTFEYEQRSVILEMVGYIKNWAIFPVAGRFSDEQKETMFSFIDIYNMEWEMESKYHKDAPPFTDDMVVEWACRVTIASIPGASESINEVAYDDMLYLPLCLNLPLPKFDLILTDESQDFNSCQLLLLEKLSKTGARVIVVGDKWQCVTEDSLIQVGDKQIQACDVVKDMQITAACGNSAMKMSSVMDVHCKSVVDADMIKIVTKKGFSLTTTPEHTYFAGYSGDDSRYFVYLMYKVGLGYRVGYTSNRKNNGFGGRLNQERADKMWLIGTYNTEVEARYYEQYYSATYGLPTWVFHDNGGTMYDQKMIDRLFSEVDTEKGAKQLLQDKLMFLQYPHHIPKCMQRKRYRNFNITLCGDARNSAMHRYSIAGSSQDDAEFLLSLGLKVRESKKTLWRVDSSHGDVKAIYEILGKISSSREVSVVEKARFTDTTLPFTPASHVLKGMKVYVHVDGKIELDEVVSAEKVKYTGRIFDYNVNRYHNFVANNIVTHNSLYRFRGADCNAFDRIGEMLKNSNRQMQTCELPINYRCDSEIINHARQWVPKLQGNSKALGTVGEISFADAIARANPKSDIELPDGIDGALRTIPVDKNGKKAEHVSFAFLCRINLPIIVTAYQLISKGKKICIIGRKEFGGPMRDMVVRLCGDPTKPDYKMRSGTPTNRLSDLRNELGEVIEEGFLTRLSQHVIMQAAKWTGDEHKKKLEDLLQNKECLEVIADRVTEDTVAGLLKEIDSLFSDEPQPGDIVLSTVHKSKGLEWDVVCLLRPDLLPHPLAKPNVDGSWSDEQQQEQNARYVCATRARHRFYYVTDWPFGPRPLIGYIRPVSPHETGKQQKTESPVPVQMQLAQPPAMESTVQEVQHLGEIFVDDGEPF